MNLYLIKLGKAIKTIQRDGIIRGGKRVFTAFFSMFRWVGTGDVLFITGGVGDSALYRAFHVAEELELHGFRCSVTLQDNPLLATYADKFSIFIFHRTLYVGGVVKLIEKIKQQNKEIIFETDDLVYDPKYLEHMDYFKQINALEKKLYENGVGGEILRDPYVKVCTTTTTFLADKLKEEGKKVFIVPNKLSNRDVEIADEILAQKTAQRLSLLSAKGISEAEPQENIRIGYFSGTNSHNKDFATIVDALMEIMEKYPQVRLVLVGPLDVENKLNRFNEQIERLAFVPRAKHFENKASVDIALAPLELDNPFCESKSENKFSESGLLEIPTVAVANQTFREAISDGVDGFVARDTAEWVEKLEKLITDKEFRINMGKLARDKVVLKYTNKNSNNEEYYEYLRHRMSNAQ